MQRQTLRLDSDSHREPSADLPKNDATVDPEPAVDYDAELDLLPSESESESESQTDPDEEVDIPSPIDVERLWALHFAFNGN
jgi:hypothetical protein